MRNVAIARLTEQLVDSHMDQTHEGAIPASVDANL